jgi:hypothetical protein
MGPDNIHYQMLKHLPETSQFILLDLFNSIWHTGNFPPSWSEATIVPLPKPDKDHSSVNSYRPIALTSFMGKTFERMVSNRLTCYLESIKILSDIQNGFTNSGAPLISSYVSKASLEKLSLEVNMLSLFSLT